MRKLIFILIPLFLLAAGCSQKENNPVSGLVLDAEEVTISGLGGSAEIGYTIENPVDGQEVKAVSGETWVSDITVSDSKISFYVDENLTEEVRKAVVEVTYGSSRTYFTVVQGDEYPVEGEFAIDMISLNDYELKCSITPEQEDMTYLYGIVDRATYDRFSSNDYFWDYVIEKTPDFASKTVTGSIDELSFDHLTPNTRYIVYCAGVDNNGDNITDVSVLKFSTKDPITFELTQDVDGPMVTLHAKPSYDDRWFFFDAFTVDECVNGETPYAYILAMLQDECAQLSWWLGMTYEEYMRGIMTLGESSKKKECLPSTDYYAVAMAMDFECNATSEMAMMEFKTDDVHSRDLEISIEITDITSLSAKYKTTVTTDDQYLFFIEAMDVIRQEWSTDDDELMQIIASIFPTDTYGRVGNQQGNVTYLEPGKEYLAFAFGCEAATPTTPLFKAFFNSKEAYVGEVEFELQFDKYYDGTELEQLYPTDFAGASGYAVLPVTPYTQNGSGYYYHIYDGDCTDPEEYPDDLVIENLEVGGTTEGYAVYLIPYNTTRTALGVAYDAEYNYGKVFRKLVYCTEDEALPGSEYGKSSVAPVNSVPKLNKIVKSADKL